MDQIGTDKRYFIVEGNIGAGKSTLLRILKEQLNVPIIFEPVEKWQTIEGTTENLLEKFYSDTQRWAYTFQSYAFITRVLALEDALKTTPYQTSVLERSVFSDRYCFARNCYEQGNMNALEWKLYQEWFVWLVNNVMTKPAGFIYLKADPKKCYERLCKRGRSEESPVALDYLQQLHNKHEKWLIEKDNIADYLQDLPVLVLDCNQEFESDVAVQRNHIKYIRQFIHDEEVYVPKEKLVPKALV